MLAVFGLDPISDVARNTGDNYHFFDGIVTLVGLFAISEILVLLENEAKDRSTAICVDIWIPDIRELWLTRWAMARESVSALSQGCYRAPAFR